jgi:hypothetical protein
VAVAVGGVGEPERDAESIDEVQLRAVLHQLGAEPRADQAGQELTHDHVLVLVDG